MPSPVYVRVKDKGSGHRYDVLKRRFNPEVHELVTKGPLSGETTRPRRIQYNEKKAKKSTVSGESQEQVESQPPAEPSGETNKETED